MMGQLVPQMGLTMLGTMQQHAKYKQEQKQQRQLYDLESKRQHAEYVKQNKELKAQQKQAKATARARMAGQGRMSEQGSAAALLNGLNRRSAEDLYHLQQDYKSNTKRRSLLRQENAETVFDRLQHYREIGDSFNEYF